MPVQKLTIDFETKSRENIKKRGMSRYVRHKSTDVLCLSFSKNGSRKPTSWWPLIGEAAKNPNACVIPPCPPIIRQAIEERWEIHAHNAGFEIAVWYFVMVRKYGWPPIPQELWRCTAAKAAYFNLPRALDKLGVYLQLKDSEAKDTEGKRLMLKMSCPDKKGNFVEDSATHARVRAYCDKDVIAEEVIDEKLPEWQESEIKVWQLDCEINERGIPLDLKLCRGAMKIYNEAMRHSCRELSELTGGHYEGEKWIDGTITKPTQAARIVKYAGERGVNIGNLREATVSEAMGWELPKDVRRIFEIRQAGGSAAVKKYQAAINFADDDCRARQLLMYYGGLTGRWAGKAIQPHNFKRGKAAEENLLRAIATGDYTLMVVLYGAENVINLLKSAVKSLICAGPGNTFCISDFSGIEARVLQWFAGHERMLKAFRDGEDIYVSMACDIYNCKPSDIVKGYDDHGDPIYQPGGKEKRQVGKVAVLGLGYGMGAQKFVATVKAMANIDIDLDLAMKVVAIYRQVNASVVTLWKSVEKACVMAIRDKKHIRFGKLQFKCEGPYLKIRLPSGRWLHYYQPKVKAEDGLYGVNYRITYLNKKHREDTYGGKLVENIVQAASRDLLCDAMFRARDAGLAIVMHVHDEVVIECPIKDEPRCRELLHKCMTEVAPWAAGCPVGAETHSSKRYTK